MSTTTGPNDTVRLRIDDGIAELRLSDPDRRNAFSPALGEDLVRLMLEIDDRDDVAVVTLTAEGHVFCAGLDVGVLSEGSDEERAYMSELLGAASDWLYWSEYPVVGGGVGAMPGGGAILMTATDIRVVSDDAALWWPEIAFGLGAHDHAIGLVSAVGAPKATEIVLLGEEAKVGAEEARSLGLVNRVVPTDEVDETVREIAEGIARYDDGGDLVREHLRTIQHARQELKGASPTFARGQVLDVDVFDG